MAHFAELDADNKVLRVVVACDKDISDNGGDQEETAANHFGQKTVKLSFNGVKWVQTSYNDNFRKRFAGIGMYYDPVNDVFIHDQPFASWTLDSEFEWQPPVARPAETEVYRNISWDEDNQRWLANHADNSNVYRWNPETSEFVLL
jgi:hypothetical protein|tara:strand:- start:4369 stop:4806 length:438 start_codon:yes stop_codon:yes gene_type:complete